ncbi:Pls/PosA family non-ribosomal peptide synthetase [Pseudonocardia sp. KRD291]|uniref:Pls/PosA family non-ribosomal peptide synthetase n=1 Tax=Pseudonocardia sp. KRD291 TaxID=2792007 RepID=UPI001C49CD6D|nr:Pls/PosA family non-ribosomal peptide synthetase [Pseudonocardia sp. KRD291]
MLTAGTGPEPPRTRPGERLVHLFEQVCDARPDSVAVDTGEQQLTYAELDAWANRLGRHLLDRGARPGDRIALLFDQAIGSYVGMLAVLKIDAAFVPVDVGFPPDRIDYILSDSAATMLLTSGSALGQVDGLAEATRARGVTVVCTWEEVDRILRQDADRISPAEREDPADELAYIIYTSGSTGRPKGVAVEHPSICNFVRVAAEVYGITGDDRMYQGLTIAFDFSVEEIWVPWMAGATLVPKPAGVTLLGPDLHEFLTGRGVTAMCCVPTLLATLDDDVPDLRFLLVSGEACPQNLVQRWYREDRRFLNVYGPTEATVTATWTELHPDRAVTIGTPLPTYMIVVLDPENPDRALPHGETGEIGIAGVGLAREYLGREDKTRESFVPDFLGLPANPSGRIYRTGDLGRVDEAGEIEYQGRIDLQVKIRGYRIEIGEIESVLLAVDGVAQAVVDTFEPVPGTTELVGYYSARGDRQAPDARTVQAHLRDRLPAYMVPTYLEPLETIPMTTSDKADRKNLPVPTGGRLASGGPHVEAEGDVERGLAEILAGTLGVEAVSVTGHFFDELGATSLLMARFAAQVRGRPDLPTVSARDVYRHPSVRDLAANLGEATGAPSVTDRPVPQSSSLGYVLTGTAQAVLLAAFALLGAIVASQGYRWAAAGAGWVAVGGRAALAGVAVFAALCVLPVLAKWLLLGRWKEAQFPVWSARYLRFWVVTTLLRMSPMTLFAGSPLYNLHLRALGARVGRGAVVLTRDTPVVTDLLRIGERTLVHPEVAMRGYRVVGGRVETGPVELGDDCWVGEGSVLDVRTAMGDGAQLGHSSALHPGRSLPAGTSWHGSPAERTTTEHRTVPPSGSGRLRATAYSAALLTAAAGTVAVALAAVVLVYREVGPLVAGRLGLTAGTAPDATSYALGAAAVVGLYVAVTVLALLAVMALPRLAAVLITPGRAYPLHGVHHLVQQLQTLLSNSRFLVLLLGDSSFITGYLRGMGYDLTQLRQTGSNFGTQLRQDAPGLTTVGSGTMVSDGLRVMNVDYSHDAFTARPVALGENNFVGNDVHFPAGARTGDNVLLATKAMIPMDGPVRQDTGLLGSPPMEISRTSTGRESDDAPFPEGDELAGRLRAKNRYNAGTVAVVLFLRALGLALALLPSAAAAALWPTLGVVALAGALILGSVLLVVWSALLERAVLGFRSLSPRYCTIYDRYFWHHERLWKFYVRAPLPGTPFANIANRIAGLQIGRRGFDDGAGLPEKSLVTIGDDVTLNALSVIQCHSLEDGYFQSDRVHVGDGATLGVRAFAHYGTSIGDGARLAADSFLLKGEQVGPHESWGGNPAVLDGADATPAGDVTETTPEPGAVPAG